MKETRFKKTKVGYIPEDWDVCPLDKVASVFGRIGFRGYTVNDLVAEGRGAITLSPSNIQNGVMNYDKCSFLTWEKYEESPEIKIENGDILFVKTGSTYGKVAFVENLPQAATINPQFVVFKKIKCNNKVLSFMLGQNYFKEQIEAITSGGAIPTMSQAKLMQCVVKQPSLAEQTAIARALTDMDDLISSLKKLIEKKRNIKQGAMQQLLSGKQRLEGFEEPWVEKMLGEVCTFAKGNGLSKSKLSPTGLYPCVLYGEIFTTYDYEIKNCVSRTHYREGTLSNKGDVIMPSSTTTSGRDLAKAVAIHDDNFRLGGDIIIIRNTYNFYDEYFLAALITEMYKNRIEEVAHGTTIYHLRVKDIVNLRLSLPSLTEQTAIARVLTDMDAELAALSAKLAKYEDLKQGMMQQLLTGKIRLI